MGHNTKLKNMKMEYGEEGDCPKRK